MASEKLIQLTDANFAEEAGKDLPLVVDFWAEWCGPCRAVAPAFEALAEEMEGKARFGKLNIDENNQTAAQYGIRSIPAFMVFKGSEVAAQFMGAMPKDALKKKIEEAIG